MSPDVIHLPAPGQVDPRAVALAEGFAAQPQVDGLGLVPFQVSIAVHALAEDLGTTVGVALAVALWLSPGFPERANAELREWIEGREFAQELERGELDPEDVQRMRETAMRPGGAS